MSDPIELDEMNYPPPTFDNIIRKPQRHDLNFIDSNVEVVSLTNSRELGSLPLQVNNNIMSASNPPRNKWRIYAVYYCQVANGFNDAAPGALLHYIEQDYNISYSVVSLIWMLNALGFIFVACMSHKIQKHLGKFKSLLLGTLSSILMYSIVLSGTKFPVIVFGFFFGGCGLAIVLSQFNVFLSRLDKLSKYLSICHGSYGVGATISPLIATAIASKGIKWHYFYLILLALMISNTIIFSFVFKGADVDLAPWDHDDVVHPEQDKGNSAFMDAVKNRLTWIAAFFVLFYQGAEVSLAGWIVTFLLDYRHGDKTVGYVASGFWGGLTVGRLLLARPLHKYFGVRRSIIVVTLISLVLVILSWVIHNVLVVGIFISLSGVFIGPNYPLMISLVADLLPRKIQVVSLTITSAFGSSGGAIFPFVVGLISQRAGAFVVLPSFLALYSTMLVLWLMLPNKERLQKGQPMNNIWQRLW